MNEKLYALPERCTGCMRCSYACSAVKEGVFQPSRARIQIGNFAQEGYSVPNVCFQCPTAPCLKACPVDAISRNESDVVVVDDELCTGCGDCVTACPYGMIEQDVTGIAYKCDYCGGDPACVRECFPGAIVYREGDKEIRRARGLQMKERSDSGSPSEKRQRLALSLCAAARG